MSNYNYEDEPKIKKTVEASVQAEFTIDSAIETGNVENLPNSYIKTSHLEYTINDETVCIEINTADILSKFKPYITLSDMRESYQQNGKSAKEILNNLEQDIISHKNNPIYIIKTLSSIASGLAENYDSNKGHADQGDTAEEMLEKFLSLQEGEELDGFVCMNIHELVAKIAHECGMNAVVLCGKSNQSESHATLLYQIEDGKFVYTDYGKSMIIQAPNIKEAARAVYKKVLI